MGRGGRLPGLYQTAAAAWRVLADGGFDGLGAPARPVGHHKVAVFVFGCVGKEFFVPRQAIDIRSEEHTSELQSLMRISYAVFCLKKKIFKTYTILSTHIYFFKAILDSTTNLSTSFLI